MSLGKGDKRKNRLAENIVMTTIKTNSCKRNSTDTFLHLSIQTIQLSFLFSLQSF